MSREIKFRAWDKEIKQFSCVFEDYRIKDINDYTDYEIMQYTGLKDKNGKKIYEGDIVKYKDFSNGAYLFREQPLTKDVVTWNKDTCGYKVKHMGLTFKAETYEIIGNIYENPELLEVVE